VRALAGSAVSPSVNPSFVERHNGTDRHRNARKTRKTYRSPKDGMVPEAMTHLSYCSDNFCWPVRTLRRRARGRRLQERTPAMAAGLANHVWSYKEWFTYPAVQR
jgi:hypothetical protein